MLVGEVTNIFKVTKIIAANCAHHQQTVTEQSLPDGQVYIFNLCAELCTIWEEDTCTQTILIYCGLFILLYTFYA